MPPPKVFVSYSHDSKEHRAWVAKLATDLRLSGINAILDQWDLSLGQDIALFMQRGVADSDRVIMICSESYVKKSDAGSGGVGYKRMIITSEVGANIDTRKFIPVIRSNASTCKTPSFLGPRLFMDLSADDEYQNKLEQLIRELHNTPAETKPGLGGNPSSGSISSSASTAKSVSSTGITISGKSIVDDDWFKGHAALAAAGHAKLGFKALTDLRYSLHSATNKSQIDLLNGVRKSEIHTFGPASREYGGKCPQDYRTALHAI